MESDVIYRTYSSILKGFACSLFPREFLNQPFLSCCLLYKLCPEPLDVSGTFCGMVDRSRMEEWEAEKPTLLVF